MFTVFSTSSAEALQMGLYKEHECPFIGVCSGTLLSLGSFLCKKQHWPSCSLSPFSFSRSTIPKERQECLSEEIAPNGEYLLGGFCSLPGGDNAFLPLEGQWVCCTCDISQSVFLPQPLKGVLPHLPTADGCTRSAFGMLEVFCKLSRGGHLGGHGSLQPTMESNGGVISGCLRPQPHRRGVGWYVSREEPREVWAACRGQGFPVLPGPFLVCLLMPLENLFWEEEAIVFKLR